MDTNSRKWKSLIAAKKDEPQPRILKGDSVGTFLGVKWTQIYADGSVTGEPRLSSRVVVFEMRFLRAFSAGRFFGCFPRARRLTLGYKYSTPEMSGVNDSRLY